MVAEKRKGDSPVPDHYETYLSVAQLAEFHKLENYGWHLVFIRRPLFQETVVVVADADDKTYGVLETDGSLNTHPDIQLRNLH